MEKELKEINDRLDKLKDQLTIINNVTFIILIIVLVGILVGISSH